MTDFLFRAPTEETHIDEWEGLRAYLLNRPTRPVMPSADEYVSMSTADRDAFNRGRQDYIVKGIRVNAGTNSLMKLYRRARRGNIISHSNTGLIIDGLFSTGKTTQCRRLMEQTFDRYIERLPDYEKFGYIPIAYVEAPPRSSGRALMIAILRFYGGTVIPRETTDILLHKVIKVMQRAQTELLIIDEFQNVADKNKNNGETVDYIKELSNAVSATFVLAGIDVINSDVLTGRRGGQLLSRYVRHQLAPFPFDTPETKKDWKAIINGFETALPLFGQEKGSLVRMSALLHQKTKGSIGSLAKMLRGAAIEVIVEADTPHEETISEELITDWQVDAYAQFAPEPKSKQPA